MDIKSSNPNAFKELNLRLAELASKQGKVGWVESHKYPETTTEVAYVATIQEFGSPEKNIPPRPFMRPAVIENSDNWKNLAAQGARAILSNNSTAENVMLAITQSAKNSISKNIATLVSPELKPSTIHARRSRGKDSIKPRTQSVKPLEDTGLMSTTLDLRVEDAS